MMYLADDRQRNLIYVFASAAGADTNPDWYHNIIAHPAEIESSSATAVCTAPPKCSANLNEAKSTRDKPPATTPFARVPIQNHANDTRDRSRAYLSTPNRKHSSGPQHVLERHVLGEPTVWD
jgi:hypothetical protein